MATEPDEKKRVTTAHVEPRTLLMGPRHIRISADLIPRELRGKPLVIIATANHRSMVITMRPMAAEKAKGRKCDSEGHPLYRRGDGRGDGRGRGTRPVQVKINGKVVQGYEMNSWYSGDRGKSPYVTGPPLYESLRWRPATSRVCHAKLSRDGTIRVRIA